ncbi:MAG: hypothetical protein GF416_08410 [Candidatus Altiarchaeales archaeon]|nr:hypothetical protein [Candidatus Altiarchaeales archaeon]MBD3417137.1 hypothetical protein [Candidatus Altiarchaeales archaeon]
MDEENVGIRLDYLMNVIDALRSDSELESLLGSPVEKHLALVYKDNDLKIFTLTPYGEEERQHSEEDKARVREICGAALSAALKGGADDIHTS